jgi:hypothetical protein
MGERVPHPCQDWSGTEAAYWFLSDLQVEESEILQAHVAGTRALRQTPDCTRRLKSAPGGQMSEVATTAPKGAGSKEALSDAQFYEGDAQPHCQQAAMDRESEELPCQLTPKKPFSAINDLK